MTDFLHSLVFSTLNFWQGLEWTGVSWVAGCAFGALMRNTQGREHPLETARFGWNVAGTVLCFDVIRYSESYNLFNATLREGGWVYVWSIFFALGAMTGYSLVLIRAHGSVTPEKLQRIIADDDPFSPPVTRPLRR